MVKCVCESQRDTERYSSPLRQAFPVGTQMDYSELSFYISDFSWIDRCVLGKLYLFYFFKTRHSALFNANFYNRTLQQSKKTSCYQKTAQTSTINIIYNKISIFIDVMYSVTNIRYITKESFGQSPASEEKRQKLSGDCCNLRSELELLFTAHPITGA